MHGRRSSFLLFLGFTACLNQARGAAAVQESATELNLNTRFGRMEMALERVAAKEREEFIRVHKGWGGRVRIADCELAGLRMTTKEEAEVSVRVAWYSPDEQELRQTTLRQTWHDHKGDWLLEKETRIDGDVGLMGEKIVPVAAPHRENTQFPTVRLGDD